VLVREGGSHTLYRNRQTGARSAIPRHGEIPNDLARTICKQLGIPYIGEGD